ncbi:MAG: hypothetical protein ACE5LU_20165 [Anaerolineae bacterium]
MSSRTNLMHSIRHRMNPRIIVVVGLLIIIHVLLAEAVPSAQAADPVKVGYRDFYYGTTVTSKPTGEKPESKLWFNDGVWWSSLWNDAVEEYHIYRLDLPSQMWVDTGTALDDRPKSKADTLWDGQHLYVASHRFTKKARSTKNSNLWGRLYRYSYDPLTEAYSLDDGFPVEVTRGPSEALVLAKDAMGTLWVTYTQNQKVMLNHSLNGDDSIWGAPFALPVDEATGLTTDDISSIITYNQHLGVMWSNQTDMKMYFAVHPVGTPDHVWTRVIPYSLSTDDHMNLKSLEIDSTGNVLAVIKTSKSSALIVLLVCENNMNRCKSASDWTYYPVYRSSTYNPTRPILLIDTENRKLYIFTRNKENGDAGIYYKATDLDNIEFPVGIGVPFIKSTTDTNVNDPTSTKQNLNSATGLVVLASDKLTHYYLHNYMSLSSSNNPIITSFSPASGPVGTEVALTGGKFAGATDVTFNGVSAIPFTVDSDTQIRAIVPAGATTGAISVTNADGTGTSVDAFTVITPPTITSFTPTSGPQGTEVALAGTGFIGATVVTFNGVPVSSFTVNSDIQIQANVPVGATTGPISVINAAGTGTSTDNFTVTEPSTAQYTLIATIEGSGNVTFDPPGGSYDDGTVVTLTANPGSGFEFSGWSGDLSGSSNPVTITMDSDKLVTATFTQQSSGGGNAITHEETQSGGSASASSVTTSTSLTAVSDDLYLAAIATKPEVGVQTLSGLGLTWTSVQVQCAGRGQTGVEVWMAQGAPTSNDTVSAILASIPSNAVIAVSRYSGVDTANPIGNVVSGNTNGTAGACSGGSDSDTYLFDLTATVDGAVVYGAAAMRQRRHTPGAGYTERAEVTQGSGGGTAGVAVQDETVASAATVAVDGAFDKSVDWAVVAVEIKP